MSSDLAFISSPMSRESFGDVIRQYQNVVAALSFSIVGDLQQSEDIAQETFVVAWKKLTHPTDKPQIEPGKLGAWLCGIARNLAHNWIRKTQHSPQISTETRIDDCAAPQTESVEQREQKAALVWDSLKNLSETYREPLVMFYQNGASIREIAAALELSESCVKQRISRGRQLLKGEISKRYESILEQIRPTEHFAVAVLAAIPILAAGKQTLAASSAAYSAGVAAKSSGGVPFLSSVPAYMASLTEAVFFPLTVLFGVIFGAWNGIRNSPTLRSRRFMFKATIFQTLIGLSIYIFICVFGRSCVLLIGLISGEPSVRDFKFQFLSASFVLVGLYCLVSSYVINRHWRKIVEEDERCPAESESIEQSGLSLRRLRNLLCYYTALPFVVILPIAIFTIVTLEYYGESWRTYFEYYDHIYPLGIVIIPLFGVPLIVTLFYHAAKRMVLDEQSLDLWRPQIPNILQVLRGEEKPKTGLRFRTNFWSDILLVGVGLCMIQGGICGNSFADHSPQLSAAGIVSIQCCYTTVFVISFVAYLLFAVFYAGIPRKRYFGHVYFGSFLAVLNSIFVLIIEPWLYNRLGVTVPSWHSDYSVLALLLFWIFCFVMAGVTGLWSFRCRNPRFSG